MSVEDCGNVELPPWSYSVPSLNSEPEDPSDPASKIASLLLAKLADYVVPGEQRGDRKIGTAVVDTHMSFHLSTVAAVLCDKRDEEGRRTREEREEERFQDQCSHCTNNFRIFLFALRVSDSSFSNRF